MKRRLVAGYRGLIVGLVYSGIPCLLAFVVLGMGLISQDARTGGHSTRNTLYFLLGLTAIASTASTVAGIAKPNIFIESDEKI